MDMENLDDEVFDDEIFDDELDDSGEGLDEEIPDQADSQTENSRKRNDQRKKDKNDNSQNKNPSKKEQKNPDAVRNSLANKEGSVPGEGGVPKGSTPGEAGVPKTGVPGETGVAKAAGANPSAATKGASAATSTGKKAAADGAKKAATEGAKKGASAAAKGTSSKTGTGAAKATGAALRKLGTGIMSLISKIPPTAWPYILAGIGIILLLILIILIVLFALGSYQVTSTGTYNGNIMQFIAEFEGSTPICATSSGNEGYIGVNIGDGTVTIGPGVTNHVIGNNLTGNYINEHNYGSLFNSNGSSYSISVGDCIDKSIVEEIGILNIEEIFRQPVITSMNSYGITLPQHQIDALTSFNYNLGAGYIDDLMASYVNGGYEGLWDEMKLYVSSGTKFETGLKKRRKAEFALFVTGDYSDQGLFYGRNINNYDYYDSENVMAREYKGGTASASGFIYPISTTAYCTSPYGTRIHPITHQYSTHYGLDIAIGSSPNILAAADGEVIAAGYNGGAGNNVTIMHSGNNTTRYLHMKNGSLRVTVGDHVKQGDVIGVMGTTGNSTGDHLHFEVKINGVLADPADYIPLEGNVYDVGACRK